MSDGGKGSSPRPMSVKYEDFANSFDAIFGKKRMTPGYKDNGEDFGSCSCGRSPTGECCGWHGLGEDAYRQKLAEHTAEQNK